MRQERLAYESPRERLGPNPDKFLVDTDYMTGVAKVKGTVKILLDLDRVLGADGTISLKAA